LIFGEAARVILQPFFGSIEKVVDQKYELIQLLIEIEDILINEIH
jgi:hypothetical protein